MKSGEWVILASGPSLTQDDIDRVQRSGVPTIAVNTTWEKAPWCHVVYGGDRVWWKQYGQGVAIKCPKITRSRTAARMYGLKYHKCKLSLGLNSGVLAIDWAIRQGGKRIVLLGFDCSLKHGVHHHGPHQKTPNPSPNKVAQWLGQFRELREAYPDVDIMNCSRYTEIDAFPRADLENCLSELTLHRSRA